MAPQYISVPFYNVKVCNYIHIFGFMLPNFLPYSPISNMSSLRYGYNIPLVFHNYDQVSCILKFVERYHN